MLSYRLPNSRDRVPLPRRLSGIALAVAVNLLLLFVLLTLGVIPVPMPKTTQSIIVDLVPAPSPAPTATASPAKARRAPPRERPVRPHPVPEKAKLPALRPLDMIEMSSAELAAADIRNLPKSGEGSGADDSPEVGRGPNGEVLYAAEWARKPTDAELSGYLPAHSAEGYGLIACKTIPGDRVDDCIELETYPRGSHLARAVREAAWQFRVRPPRRNGRPLVGEWVQIRIDYYHSGS